MNNPPNLVNRLRSVVIVLAKGVMHHREKVEYFARLGQMERADIHQKISERQLFAFKRQEDVCKILFGTTSTSAVAAMEHLRDDQEEAMREELAAGFNHEGAKA